MEYTWEKTRNTHDVHMAYTYVVHVAYTWNTHVMCLPCAHEHICYSNFLIDFNGEKNTKANNGTVAGGIHTMPSA